MVQRRCDLISKRAQIINREPALLTTAQMIGYNLKLITIQILIDIRGSLSAREMLGSSTSGERFFTYCKERLINIHASLDLRAARFTLAKVIARSQQFRSRQTILSVVLNLFLSQVFHWFSI